MHAFNIELIHQPKRTTMNEIVYVTVMKWDSKVIWFLTNQICQNQRQLQRVNAETC